MHCSSWCLPLSAESLRQLALLQARHINPDSIYKGMYGCSGGAPFTAVYFGARQFLAHTEINTAVCVDTTPSPPLLKDFTCGCHAQKKPCRNKHSLKCHLASMWEGKTWTGITSGVSSSLLGKQKALKVKKKERKKKGSFKKFRFRFIDLAAVNSGRRNATVERTFCSFSAAHRLLRQGGTEQQKSLPTLSRPVKTPASPSQKPWD